MRCASGTAAAAGRSSRRSGRRVVGPQRGYAWTRSLLAERAATGRIALQTVDTSDTSATLGACRARRGPAVAEDRRATRCSRSPSSTACAVVASPSPWIPRSPRRFCSGRWSSARRSPCTVRQSSSAAIPTCCSAWSACATTLDCARCSTRGRRSGRRAGNIKAFLALRGLRTLPVRLELFQRTAQTLAERLSAHPAVSAHAGYPGSGRCSALSAATRWRSVRRFRSSPTPRASAASRA